LHRHATGGALIIEWQIGAALRAAALDSAARKANIREGQMNRRKLGRSGLEIAPLVFGGNVFGWTVDEAMGFRLLDAFVAAGFNAIDTADAYSRWVPGHTGGESETLIGKWLKRSGNRDKVLIFTKVGIELAPDKKGLSRARIFRAAEDSLSRLQTDHIDLYQSHIDDAESPLEETLGAYADLIKQGKVRAIGASNYKANRLEEALQASRRAGVPRYESLQPHYNLLERNEYETQLEPVCLKEGLGVINYYPLASGFLTGKYRSEADLEKSPRGKSAKKHLNERGLKILAALDQVARQQSATPAQVALAWCLARPSITAPIVSATNLEQLQELMRSADLTLDRASLGLLDRAGATAGATTSAS
jgi:aryl-alcohol dehydrogenase-like predicted oxidoreductase